MKIGPFIIARSTPTPSDAAAILGKRGAAVRKANERERIHAKARQLCAEMDKPIPAVLKHTRREWAR